MSAAVRESAQPLGARTVSPTQARSQASPGLEGPAGTARTIHTNEKQSYLPATARLRVRETDVGPFLVRFGYVRFSQAD